MQFKTILLFSLLLLGSIASVPDNSFPEVERWVEQTIQQMSLDECIGQLIMVPVHPKKGEENEALVKSYVEDYHVGGLIMFQGGPQRTIQLINQYQALSTLPMLVAIDGEWGVQMRLDSVLALPKQMLLGAIQENQLIYDYGRLVAEQCKRLGIHINFAPVVDINNNSQNPVIGDRSFGESRSKVTDKAYKYMKGMEDHGIMTCLKHFPGHGDTHTDSHYDLPIIKHSKERLDSVELYPFKQLFKLGASSVMVAHLHIPALDKTENLPTTLSHKVVTELLQLKLKSEGLIFTDALNMKGVTKHFKDGEAEVKALQAGVDILLMPENVEKAIVAIKKAIINGDLDTFYLKEKVRKILRVKYKLGLTHFTPIPVEKVGEDLNQPTHREFIQKLAEKSITLLKNENKLIPISPDKTNKVASLSIGYGDETPFQSSLSHYGVKKNFQLEQVVKGTELLPELQKFETVIIGLHKIGRIPQRDFGINSATRDLIQAISKKSKVILVVFGNAYALKYFENIPGLICTYHEDPVYQRTAAKAIFGWKGFYGKLPVGVGTQFPEGHSILMDESHASEFEDIGKELGFDMAKISAIDDIAFEAIDYGATPGCQVLVMKNGKKIYHKTYGYTTYDKTRKVQKEDVYDLASVTKVAATTISLMKLYETGKLDLNKTLGDYIPELKGSNKENLKINQVLAHEAGLKAWIPIYLKGLDKNKNPDNTYFRKSPNASFNIQINDSLFTNKVFLDSIFWKRIIENSLDEPIYRYSDLGFILFTKLIENISGKPLDEFVMDNFYKPMNLSVIGYKPLSRSITKERIIPTEEDQYFRKTKVQGFVHDPNAALLGGVSGHAGLFSNATDLAAVYQMLLDKGMYQGKRYLEERTVELFTAQFSPRSRRGLGFDRKELGNAEISHNVAWQASPLTYGHLGFTGIGAWADPENKIIYIFLSNRTYPSGENAKLVQMNIRPRIQEKIYKAIIR
jgi:beta-N-acetylhexosaminidase